MPVLTGCASTVRVQALATGQDHVQAYQLFGTRLDELRNQLPRLCPRGAEVLRVADEQHQTVPAGDGRVAGWMAALTDQVTPNNSRAQMVVLCARELPAEQLERLAAMGAAAKAQSAKAATTKIANIDANKSEAADFSLSSAITAITAAATVRPKLPPPSNGPVTGYDE